MISTTANDTVRGFWQGFSAPWAGFRHMCRHPGLWRYGVIPMLLNFLLTAIVLFVLVSGAVAFATYLHSKFPDGGWWMALEVVCAIGLLVIAAGATAAAWILLQGILFGYFYGLLAREVELLAGTDPEELSELALGQQLLDAVRDLAWLLAINVACLSANCIPVVGSVVALCGATYFIFYFLGRSYLDFPLALRGRRREQKQEFFKRHRRQTLGMGAFVLPCGLVPFFGAVILTTAVVGGVLIHHDLQPADDG